MDIIIEDSQNIQNVELVGLHPAEEVDEQGLDFVLCLQSKGGVALVVKLMLYRGGPSMHRCSMELEFEDCLETACIPRAAIDSSVIQACVQSAGPEGVYEQLMSCLGARASTLSVRKANRSAYFTLKIGTRYTSELQVPLKSIEGYLAAT